MLNTNIDKPKRDTRDGSTQAPAESNSPNTHVSPRKPNVLLNSPQPIRSKIESPSAKTSRTPRRSSRHIASLGYDVVSENVDEDASVRRRRVSTPRDGIPSPVRKSPAKRRARLVRTKGAAPRYSLPALSTTDFVGVESPVKPAAWLNVETSLNRGVTCARGLDVVTEEQQPDGDGQELREKSVEVQDIVKSPSHAVTAGEAHSEDGSAPFDEKLDIEIETDETGIPTTMTSTSPEGSESGAEPPPLESEGQTGGSSYPAEVSLEEESGGVAARDCASSPDPDLEAGEAAPNEPLITSNFTMEEERGIDTEVSLEPETTDQTSVIGADPRFWTNQDLSDRADPGSPALSSEEVNSAVTEVTTSIKKTVEISHEPLPEDTTTHLDADTAHLKEFLNRAALSKARRVSTTVSIARRTSLQNRRDSDAVRQALASPRRVLDDKDPNSPSILKSYEPVAGMRPESSAQNFLDGASNDDDATTTLLIPDDMSDKLAQAGQTPNKPSRRSARTPKSRIPAPPSQLPQPADAPADAPNRIPVRRADGSEPVVLKKTEAQELANLTRVNTRKNKGGAVAAAVRLLKLSAEVVAPELDVLAEELVRELREGQKGVRWDEQLVYFQEGDAQPLGLGNTAAGLDAAVEAITEARKQPSKMRRLRGLGGANGTPGKGLLAPLSLLPADMGAEKDAKDVLSEEKQKEVRREKRSRLVTPRKLKLPTPTSSLGAVSEGKENLAGSKLVTPKKIALAAKVTSADSEGGLGQVSARKRIRTGL